MAQSKVAATRSVPVKKDRHAAARAREWQGEVQPVCPVDKLQAMRPAPELYGGGPSPVSWTGPVVMVQDELQQKKKRWK